MSINYGYVREKEINSMEYTNKLLIINYIKITEIMKILNTIIFI